jgi:hypothetical protein
VEHTDLIASPTAFVLGAGAHCPYGMPDGTTLTQEIIALLPQKPANPAEPFQTTFAELYRSSISYKEKLLIEFRYKLERAGQPTIDSFLATHSKKPGYPEIGKLAVAYILLPKEFKHQFVRYKYSPVNPNRDWMSYLFQAMLSGCSDIDQFMALNKVSFVTFNYDRTLEYFFTTRLANTFDISEEVAWEKAKAIQIVHVYGSLGVFNPDLIRPRKESHQASSFLDAASSIRLMYDDRGEHQNISEAKKIISDTPQVCFLGFGFDPDNVARLNLNVIATGKTTVGATRYHMADGDWNRCLSGLSPVQINIQGHRDWDSLTFLAETRMF